MEKERPVRSKSACSTEERKQKSTPFQERQMQQVLKSTRPYSKNLKGLMSKSQTAKIYTQKKQYDKENSIQTG